MNDELNQLSDAEKQEIQDFSQRLFNGEVTDNEASEIEESLSKDDTAHVRLLASQGARQRRTDIREHHTRIQNRLDRKQKKSSKKSARIRKKKR